MFTGDDYILSQLDTVHKNSKVYGRVSDLMAKKGSIGLSPISDVLMVSHYEC